MQSTRYKSLELLIIFVLIPLSFAFNYAPILKLIIGVLGFSYIIYVLFKIEKIKIIRLILMRYKRVIKIKDV